MKIQCECGNSQKANLKGHTVPKGAVILRSTMCPNCEDEKDGDYYEEYFQDKEGNNILKSV